MGALLVIKFNRYYSPEVQHVIYKVNRDFTREEFLQKFGESSTYPKVVMDGEVIGGCQETVKYLREQKLV